MDRLDLVVIANEFHINAEIFGSFMQKRFPHEEDKGYVATWAERFSSGAPQVYMDKQSKEIYNSIINQY